MFVIDFSTLKASLQFFIQASFPLSSSIIFISKSLQKKRKYIFLTMVNIEDKLEETRKKLNSHS